jgi:16S rRNA (guanine527-N7)-methyltransferase
LEYCIPFVKPDGYFVSYKGPKYKEEIELSQNALDILGSTVEKIDEIDISSQEKRYLIFVKNNKLTSSKYPRRAGMPKKKPL